MGKSAASSYYLYDADEGYTIVRHQLWYMCFLVDRYGNHHRCHIRTTTLPLERQPAWTLLDLSLDRISDRVRLVQIVPEPELY